MSSASWAGGSHLKVFLCQKISFQAHSHSCRQEMSVCRPLLKASDFPAGFPQSLRYLDRNCDLFHSLFSEAVPALLTEQYSVEGNQTKSAKTERKDAGVSLQAGHFSILMNLKFLIYFLSKNRFKN